MLELPPPPTTPEKQKMFHAAKQTLLSQVKHQWHPSQFSGLQKKVLRGATIEHTSLSLHLDPKELDEFRLVMRIMRELKKSCRNALIAADTKAKVSIEVESHFIHRLVDELGVLDRKALGDALVESAWRGNVERHMLFDFHMENFVRDMDGEDEAWRDKQQERHDFLAQLELRMSDFRERLQEVHTIILSGNLYSSR